MSPPKFAKRRDMPMTPETYRRAAKRLRGFADELEKYAAPQTAEDQRSLAFVIKNLADYARTLVSWDRRTRDARTSDGTKDETSSAT